MSGTKKQYSAAEKTKIAMEAIKGDLTMAQISNWKQQAIESMQTGFTRGSKSKSKLDQSELVDKLYKQIGKLST